MRVFIIILTALLCAAALPAKTMAQEALSVNSVRIGTHPDKTRIVVDLSRHTQFRAFTLQNPPRLVLDLPALDWRAGQPQNAPASMVKGVRHGMLQPGIARVVIELEQNVTLKSAFFLPRSDAISDRIVMDIAKPPSGWNPAQERIFGSLNSDAPQLQLNPVSGKGAAQAPPPQPTSSATGTLQLPPKKPQQGAPSPAAAGTLQLPTPPPAPAPPKRGSPPKKHIVVIDPGHGGQDPGAIGPGGLQEKRITLAAGLELKQQLEKTGRYTVHMTRTNDRFIRLQDRVAIGRKHGADLFISLHADSIDKAAVSGASIYTLSNTASDAQTAKLAARENRADLIAGIDLSHEDKEVADILIDLAMRDTMNQSKFFANTVVTQAQRQGIRLLERPHRYAGFAVLKAPDIPSVLFEMGFMSNKGEAEKLNTPAYRRKITSSMVDAIDAYFAKIHKNNQN
ncbi:MAG: N-acetylmuramoyl-L-alanine amidase [Micavibrio sp.]